MPVIKTIKQSFFLKILFFTTLLSFLPFLLLGVYSLIQVEHLSEKIMHQQIEKTKASVLSQKFSYLEKEAQTVSLELVKVENNLKLIQKQAEMVFSKENHTFSHEPDIQLVKSTQGYLREPQHIIDRYDKANFFVSSRAADASAIMTDLKKAKELEPLLKQTIKNESILKAAYLFLSESAWLTYPAMNIDFEVATHKLPPNIRLQDYEFYHIADREHNPSRTVKWTKPFQDISHWNWVIAAAAPVYLPSGELRGVVGVHFPIEYIKMKLNDIRFEEPHAFAFIIDQQGHFIGGQRNNPDDAQKPELINAALNTKKGISEVKLDEGNIYLLSTPIKNNGWILSFAVPESDIIDPIVNDVKKETSMQILSFSQKLFLLLVLGTFVLVIFSYRFSKTITNPIKQLTVALKESASGHLGKKIPVQQEDEIGKLTETFNFMNSTIQQLINELHDRADQLEDKVLERTKELEDANSQLRETYKKLKNSEELRSELIIQISHDLKTPLTSIKGYHEVLMKYDQLSEEQKREFMKLISLRLNHMIQLVNDLFDITAMDINEMHFEKEWIPIEFLLEHSLDMVIANTPKQKITVHSQIEPDLPLLFVDGKKINRAFVNILENAIKYSRNKEEIMVDIKVFQQDQEIYIQFKDQGIGITEENIKNIFTPFFRDQRAKSEKTMGSGLGLTIAQKIIHAHHGDILVESQIDQGTTMTIRLPVMDEMETEGEEGAVIKGS
ncbi:ATP-binding protein [Ammoniphilus sp. YIM 78166]|uniref:ATP-binding protein n=1 Tax=Ammoniphilus sp. YIM 78166 TaxID=1644106 RepID=UPI00106F3FDF|nr:ATP-binding protein [Ammoniphilus sp. YIM 78166]